MGWNSSKFEKLEMIIKESVAGKRHVIDVPYYIFLYDPELELECLKNLKALASRLRREGISVELMSLSSLMVDALQNLGCLNDSFLKNEEKKREEIAKDLERELLKEISRRLKEKLKDKDISHCVILTRIGSLFPFVHISSLLTQLEGSVSCTLVIPYPGNKEGNMLNYHWENIRTYYRGEII
ncbi:MAG: DUF1788 domain-containing protein [Candidatus Aenigmatarchaeota archaeon]